MDLTSMIGEVPEGWTLESERADGGHARYASPQGWVELDYYLLLDGVVLTHINLDCARLPGSIPMRSRMATLNWCDSGRCEVSFGERGSLVVGEQTLCLSSTLAESFSYPAGPYRGFEFFLDFERLGEATWTFLESFGLDKQALLETLLPHELGINLVPTGQLADCVHALESELATECPRRAWLLLGICQMLMLLSEMDLVGAAASGGYLQRSQRDMAQAVYQQIVEQEAPVASLSALARRLGVSEASLRSYFMRIYGESPAAFARNHALSKAMRLLEETDMSVADVSQACGYANPSKFSAAFRRRYDINPLEYRRRSRL